MDFSHVDWTKPVLTFEEMLTLTEYAEGTLKNKSTQLPMRKFCQPIKGGKFLYHRDAFVAWLASGQDGGADD